MALLARLLNGQHDGPVARPAGQPKPDKPAVSPIRKWKCNSCSFSQNWWNFTTCKVCCLDWNYAAGKGQGSSGAPKADGGKSTKPEGAGSSKGQASGSAPAKVNAAGFVVAPKGGTKPKGLGPQATQSGAASSKKGSTRMQWADCLDALGLGEDCDPEDVDMEQVPEQDKSEPAGRKEGDNPSGSGPQEQEPPKDAVPAVGGPKPTQQGLQDLIAILGPDDLAVHSYKERLRTASDKKAGTDDKQPIKKQERTHKELAKLRKLLGPEDPAVLEYQCKMQQEWEAVRKAQPLGEQLQAKIRYIERTKDKEVKNKQRLDQAVEAMQAACRHKDETQAKFDETAAQKRRAEAERDDIAQAIKDRAAKMAKKSDGDTHITQSEPINIPQVEAVETELSADQLVERLAAKIGHRVAAGDEDLLGLLQHLNCYKKASVEQGSKTPNESLADVTRPSSAAGVADPLGFGPVRAAKSQGVTPYERQEQSNPDETTGAVA